MKKTRVSLVGGSPILQAGIAAVLSQDPALALVEQLHGDGSEITAVTKLSGDVIVLNTDSPRHDVATIMRQFAAERTSLRVLVLTDVDSIDDISAALRLGVRGYGIRSALLPEDLLSAVRSVALGRMWTCPQTISRLIASAVESDPTGLVPWGHKSPLSERELAVLRLAVAGARESEIAVQLVVSPNTVKTYLRRIRQKLNVDSRAQAVRLAVASGLLPASSKSDILNVTGDDPVVTRRVTS